MPVLQLTQGVVEWGGRTLLDQTDLTLDAGERIGLIGRNGEGKSTLLMALAGEYPLDGGVLWTGPGLRSAYLEQESSFQGEGSVVDSILAGHPLWRELQTRTNPPLEAAGHLDHPEIWTLRSRAEALCDMLALSAGAPVGSLSGGQQKRAAIAATLLSEPDLLFLDEPTNHMDLEGIEILEKTLLRFRGTTVFITHDRRFLERLATRIVELDRGQLRSFPGDFSSYLQRREEFLSAEAASLERLEGQLAGEEAWLRQGVRARAKRNQGRLRRLERLREERRQRQARNGTAQLQITAALPSGTLVAALEDASFAYGPQKLVHNFSTRIERGDRVGIIGPNGAGKTTLLRLILGELVPQSGQIRMGTQQKVAYFDQLRSQLDPEARVMDVIADGNDFLDIGGERRHVLGYLQDFLFPPDRARGPVKSLSGGERARLLLARIFSRPANILVLDEPTNDLDLESLDLLEERLQAFPGTVLLVSHDREFLDQVTTQCIVSLGNGRWLNMAGGYADWLAWQAGQSPVTAPAAQEPGPGKGAEVRGRGLRRRRPELSFRERQELEQLPEKIEHLEQEQQRLASAMGESETYRDPERAQLLQGESRALEEQLAAAYARWEALEARLQEIACQQDAP